MLLNNLTKIKKVKAYQIGVLFQRKMENEGGVVAYQVVMVPHHRRLEQREDRRDDERSPKPSRRRPRRLVLKNTYK